MRILLCLCHVCVPIDINRNRKVFPSLVNASYMIYCIGIFIIINIMRSYVNT